MNTTLTIILCQSREFEFTHKSLCEMVLEPLQSDLAFCGVHSRESGNTLEYLSKYFWNYDEPDNWVDALNSISKVKDSWVPLLNLDPLFFGGTGLAASVGSGAIIMFWREILRSQIDQNILDRYEWFVITRSDFLWLAPHPKVSSLRSREIYLLDGEHYGGVSDRHIIFHRDYAKKILSIAEPIFQNPDSLIEDLKQKNFLNPEVYIKHRLGIMDLDRHIRFLPYLGTTIRNEGTATRWSEGQFSSKLGVYVKYDLEYQHARRIAFVIKKSEHWDRFLQNRFSARILAMKFLLFMIGVNSFSLFLYKLREKMRSVIKSSR